MLFILSGRDVQMNAVPYGTVLGKHLMLGEGGGGAGCKSTVHVNDKQGKVCETFEWSQRL